MLDTKIYTGLDGVYMLTSEGRLEYFHNNTSIIDSRLTDYFSDYIPLFFKACCLDTKQKLKIGRLLPSDDKHNWKGSSILLEDEVVKKLYITTGKGGEKQDKLTPIQEKKKVQSIPRAMETLLKVTKKEMQADLHVESPRYCPLLIKVNEDYDFFNFLGPMTPHSRFNPTVTELRQAIYNGIVNPSLRHTANWEILDAYR